MSQDSDNLQGQTSDPRQLANDAYLALVEKGGGVLLEQATADPKIPNS